MDWREMSEHERDVMVAKAMGCYVRRNDKGRFDLVIPHGINQIDFVAEDAPWRASPRYTTDHSAVAAVRAEVERRRIWADYIRALLPLVAPDTYPLSDINPHARNLLVLNYTGLWCIANAMPDQQCLAFVRACGKEV